MTAAEQTAPQAQSAPALTIDGLTQLPCPICGTAEHLAVWRVVDEQHGGVMVIECQRCLTASSVGTWNQLPRRDAGGVA